MIAHQRLLDTNGNEVCLFPLEYLRMSQGEHNLYALDFLGWGANGRIYDCPCYAPFSGEVVYTGNDHNMIYWSLNPVRLINGLLSHVSILVAHDDTPPAAVGTRFTQGDLWYHTGNFGYSSGDHLHIEVALGHVKWDTSGTHLKNPAHMWQVMAVNDTVISDGSGLNWRNYEGGITPTTDEKKHKFPWFIYSNRYRG